MGDFVLVITSYFLDTTCLMNITRTSTLTGITRTLDLPVTEEQIDLYYNRGALLQDAFPNLPAGDREFIKTGITDEEWNAAFSFPDDDEEEEEEESGNGSNFAKALGL